MISALLIVALAAPNASAAAGGTDRAQAMLEGSGLELPPPAATPAAVTPITSEAFAAEILERLEGCDIYKELLAFYAQNKKRDPDWAGGDDASAILEAVEQMRSDAQATAIVMKPGRVVRLFINGKPSDDNGISVSDMEKSEAYRETMADAIANNIAAANITLRVDVLLHGEIGAKEPAEPRPAPPAPPAPPTPSPQEPAPSSEIYGFDALYMKIGEVANVYHPGDDGYRTLSVQIYTTRDPQGNLINRIGLVDITQGDISSPSPTQFIEMRRTGYQEIAFHPGGRPYIVTIGNDWSFTVKRPNDRAGSGQLITSVQQLIDDRNDAIRKGALVTIAGAPYHVLAQGGQRGSFLFFSQLELQRNPHGNIHPDLMADVAIPLADGSSARVRGNPDLGQLPDGSHWHLEFDYSRGMWIVHPGPGN